VHQALTARRLGRGLSDPRGGDVELPFVEGAALWAQRRVLVDLGHLDLAERIERDQDPTYGGGLRRFRLLVDALGEREALALGASTSRFPPGR
jgi:hypothetical protein